MSDLISRDAAIVALAHNRYGNDEWDLAVTHDVETIKKLPSVELESKLEKCEDCISRKAATDRFDLVQSDDKCMSYDDIMAFLLSLPTVEPEKCGDCISRAEVLSTYADWYGYGYNNGFYRLVQQMKSVEPERKTGKWISEQPWCLPKCSICGASSFGHHGFDAIKTPYCPNCGADMREVQDEC